MESIALSPRSSSYLLATALGFPIKTVQNSLIEAEGDTRQAAFILLTRQPNRQRKADILETLGLRRDDALKSLDMADEDITVAATQLLCENAITGISAAPGPLLTLPLTNPGCVSFNTQEQETVLHKVDSFHEQLPYPGVPQIMLASQLAIPATIKTAKNVLEYYKMVNLISVSYVTIQSPADGLYSSKVTVGSDVFQSKKHAKKVDAEKEAAFSACLALWNKGLLEVPPRLRALAGFVSSDQKSDVPITEVNSKNVLQHYAVTHSLGFPQYEVDGSGGPDGIGFTAKVKVAGRKFMSPSRKTKKTDAEKSAALEACKCLIGDNSGAVSIPTS